MHAFFNILMKVAVVAGILLLVAGILTVFVPKLDEMQGLKSRYEGLRSQAENRQRAICELRENQTRLQTDPEYVARIAHQNKRVLPNEVVFVFEDK